MAKKEHNPIKNDINPCNNCSLCCEYIAMEIDKPVTKKDFQQIRWFLAHHNVWIFKDHDKTWNIQFNTPCEKLDEHKWCNVYKTRPSICIEHSSKNCDKWGEGDSFVKIWKTIEEFDEWLKINKPKFL